MSNNFTIIEGPVLVIDSNGNIADIVTSIAGKNRLATDSTIVGRDGNHRVDVELISGKRRMLTDSIVTVEEVFGKDPFADSWFTIVNTGAEGDTLTVSIAATTNDPSNPDRDLPAYSKIFTIQASEVGDEIALRNRIISELNQDTAFKNDSGLEADSVKDNAIVHISSRFKGEFYERPNVGDFAVDTTGAVSVVLGFDKFELRGKPNELARSPDDPRQGVLAISGSIALSPSEVADFLQERAKIQGGSSEDMNVDGSSVEQVFEITPDATMEKIIQFLTFSGADNGIKYGVFLGKNAKLTNGIIVEVKSQDEEFVFRTIDSTDDFQDSWCFTPIDFNLDISAGSDHFNASKLFGTAAIRLKPTGTFPVDDYVRVRIRDNLTDILELNLEAKGFLREV